MKKKLHRKLKLSRETLQNLTSQEAQQAAGGLYQITDITCQVLTCAPSLGDNTCINCPHPSSFC